MNKISILILLSVFTINIIGCSPANILASGGATTMVVAEGDRSLGTVVDDATIKINIASKFIISEDNLFINLNTTVLEGRVLLTGLVDNQEIRIDAVRRVWEVEGVKEVTNKEEALEIASSYSDEVFVIGGEKIYEEFLPMATKMYLTKIDIKVKGDSFFPKWSLNDWKELSRNDKKDLDQNIKYCFLEYKRK